MPSLRTSIAVLCLSAALLAQTPAERIHNGFKALSTGTWNDAFKEWDKQALPLSPSDPEPRKSLDEWIPKTWDIGSWELLKTSAYGRIWQRQWWMATFDRGVVFFAFDFARHKGEWRMFRLSVSRDPSELLAETPQAPASSRQE